MKEAFISNIPYFIILCIFLAFLAGCLRRSEIYQKVDLIFMFLLGLSKGTAGKPTDEELYEMKSVCRRILLHQYPYETQDKSEESPLETMTQAFNDSIDETKEE